MGAYTSKLGLYKPDSSEFVDVKTQLNNNWDITDSAVRRLMEYEYSSVPFPDTTSALDSSKFYKPYSNSTVMWQKSPAGFVQDQQAFVSPWINSISGVPVWAYLMEGFMEHQDYPFAFRIITNPSTATKEMEWTGAAQLVTQDPMDLNANIQVFQALPSPYLPVVSKYFMVNAGNAASNYSIARLFFSSTGTIEYKRYGTNPSGSASLENRVEFTGVRYNIEVTG